MKKYRWECHDCIRHNSIDAECGPCVMEIETETENLETPIYCPFARRMSVSWKKEKCGCG